MPIPLNPLNGQHYLLLANWIYFRLNVMWIYLYQADPVFYRKGKGWADLRRAWHIEAYRHMALIAPGVALLLSIVITLPVVMLDSLILQTPIEWLNLAVGLAAGLAFGITFGTVYGTADSIAEGVADGVVDGIAVGVIGAIPGGVIGGAAGGLGIDTAMAALFGAIGAAVFAILAGLSASRLWIAIPQAMLVRVHWNGQSDLREMGEAMRAPFRRWEVQRKLCTHLEQLSSPLLFLYTLLADPVLSEYIFTPTLEKSWNDHSTLAQLFIGELALRFVPTMPHQRVYTFYEWLGWMITWPLRCREETPLTRFAGMLYELLDAERVDTEEFDLRRYADVYAGVAAYPGGEEIAGTFAAMAEFSAYDRLELLINSFPEVSELPGSSASIRPAVLAALKRLGGVGAEIATYRDATSRANKLAALARATDALDDLDKYVQAEVVAPEQFILRRIIRQWRRLVSEAGGVAGRAQIAGPVANPYVAGNPVNGDLFVGREDVMRRLEELWSGAGQKPSVVIYGHRRMGKTSILHNLGRRFGAQSIIVDFNMQRVGLVSSTGELLYNLALAIHDIFPEGWDEPAEEQFTVHNPYTAFDRFLKQVDRVRGERRFIVAVDEFESIEQGILEGKLEPHLLDFGRGVIQTYPWFVMAFAGLHTLDEMRRDYWHPLFGSVTAIPVSFLTPAAARQLITNPAPDFALDYDEAAIQQIVDLTHGQPYLVQLIGHGLVSRFNRQTFEEGVERERRFTAADVQAVIGAPEFYRDGDAYFTGVWRQAEKSGPGGQIEVLRVLAEHPEGLTIGQMTTIPEAGNSASCRSFQEGLPGILDALRRHDVIVQADDGRWQFTVELMRRWVADQLPGKVSIPEV